MRKLRTSLCILLSLVMISGMLIIPVYAATGDDAGYGGTGFSETDDVIITDKAGVDLTLSGCDPDADEPAIQKKSITDFAATGHDLDLAATGKDYQIVVGNTLVTSKNCKDIFKDGKASYDPDKKILNLKDPVLKKAYFDDGDCGILQIQEDGVTVTGSFHMTASVCDYGVYCTDSVKFNGDFTFYGSLFGIAADSGITVLGGSLKVYSEGGYYRSAITSNGTLEICDGVKRVEGHGGTAIYVDDMVFNHNRITSPKGAFYSPKSCSVVLPDLSDYAPDVVIEPFTGTYYDVWVGYTQVTSENKSDILEDGGKAKYDPDTHTLTLNDPTIPGVHVGGSPAYKIYSESDLTVKGSYHMAAAETYKNVSYTGGIRSEKKLTLSGDFTFLSGAYGIIAENDLTIESGTLKAVGTEDAAIVVKNGTLTIKDAITKVETVSDSEISVLAKDIKLGENLKFTTPVNGAIATDTEAGYKYFFDLKTVKGAPHAVIEPKPADEPTEPPTQPATQPGTQQPTEPPEQYEKYNIWLGSTQVTEKNKDDVFNDGGKAKYDPDTHTLTLDEPEIPGIYKDSALNMECKIYIGVAGATLKGSYHMKNEDASHALCIRYPDNSYFQPVTISGDFLFKARVFGLYTNGKAGYTYQLVFEGHIIFEEELLANNSEVTCRSGLFMVNATKSDTALNCNKLNIESGVAEVNLAAKNKAATISYGYPVYADGYGVNFPAEGYWKYGSYYNLRDNEKINHIIIGPLSDERYGIWLGPIEVNSANKDDILYDGGKAKYDPATNTLTLDEPEIYGNYLYDEDTPTVICIERPGLTITGSYHMNDDDLKFGIVVNLPSKTKNTDITLRGDFTIAGRIDSLYCVPSTEINANNNLVFEGNLVFGKGTMNARPSDVIVRSGTLTVNGKTFGVLCDDLIVENGADKCEINAESVFNVVRFSIGDKMVITVPENGYLDDGYYYDQNGNKATHMVIERNWNLFDLEGKGTEDEPYLIKSAEDWNALGKNVADGCNTSSKVFKLTDDISVSTVIGSSDHPFSGVFDGDGHTLTLALDSENDFTAPFSQISGATIKNLKTDGTVKGGQHSSGFVGGINGTDENLIGNCEVAADITTSKTHSGGFVGHGGSQAKTTLKDCVFSGTINGATYAGTIWGWSDKGCTPVLNRCLDASNSTFNVGLGFPAPTLTGVYYTNENKAASDFRPWADNGKPAHTATLPEGVSLAQSSEYGVMYNGAIYAAEGDTVNLTGDENTLYAATAGTLTQSGSNLTLVMPDEDIAVELSDAEPYSQYEFIDGTEGVRDYSCADKLIDGDLQTKWCVNEKEFPLTMTFKTDEPIVAAGYKLVTAEDAANYLKRNPISWMIEGSNDGQSWTTITVEADNKTLEAVNNKAYTFSMTENNKKAFSYYRFTVIAINSGATFQLSELQLIKGDYILGDVDGDGDVNIIDATTIQRKLASLHTVVFISEAADVDGDGNFTILDATAIQRWLAGLDAPKGINKPILPVKE